MLELVLLREIVNYGLWQLDPLKAALERHFKKALLFKNFVVLCAIKVMFE